MPPSDPCIIASPVDIVRWIMANLAAVRGPDVAVLCTAIENADHPDYGDDWGPWLKASAREILWGGTDRGRYRDFVRERIDADRLSFHPDTPFSEYTYANGQPVYTPEAAATLQAEHDALLAGDFDQYEVAIEVFEELGLG